MRARPAQLTDPVLAGVLLLLGAVVLYLAAQLEGGNETDPLGPRGFPILLGAALVGSGLALAVKSLPPLIWQRRGPAADVDAEEADGAAQAQDEGPVRRWRLLLAGVAIAAYALVLPILGFLLCTVIFMAGLIVVQGGARRPAFLTAVLLFPVVVYLLFVVVLGIRLPAGVFDPMLLVGGLRP